MQDKKLTLQAKKWLQPIAQGYPALEAEYLRLEPGKNRLNQTKNSQQEAIFSTWGAIVKDVRTQIQKWEGDIAFPGIITVPVPVMPLREAA